MDTSLTVFRHEARQYQAQADDSVHFASERNSDIHKERPKLIQ